MCGAAQVSSGVSPWRGGRRWQSSHTGGCRGHEWPPAGMCAGAQVMRVKTTKVGVKGDAPPGLFGSAGGRESPGGASIGEERGKNRGSKGACREQVSRGISVKKGQQVTRIRSPRGDSEAYAQLESHWKEDCFHEVRDLRQACGAVSYVMVCHSCGFWLVTK